MTRLAPRFGLLAIAVLLCAQQAHARVGGEPHALFAEHRVVGGVTVTGNTLMTQSAVSPVVNSNLLDSSRGDVRALPFDAELEAAYLFWAGSVDGEPDDTASFVAADGTRFDAVQAERCVEIDDLSGHFSCRADVTALLADHPGDDRWNGTYEVGDVDASAGIVRFNGRCRNANCQAKFAAWSLVLVYRSPNTGTLRDVFLHDGFRFLDEDDDPGIDQFTIRGFDFPEGGEASLAFFGLEGDSFLGVPPQDTDPIRPCATCFDFMDFAGSPLTDALNPPGNLFNSSSPGGFTLGLDLDRFDVSDRLVAGQSEAEIRVGSGDGQPGGGGEAFMLGWVLLDVERNAPDFNRDDTVLAVVPDEASPGERVVFTLRITNQGTRDATNTAVTLRLPDGLTYLPGSLRLDGADPVPGDEEQNPLAAGFALGDIPFRGDTDRQISFRATVDADAAPGTRLRTTASITADTLDDAVETNEAIVTVLGAPALGEVVKTVIDEDGDDLFVPGEQITYEVFIGNDNDRPVSGVRLIDDLPRQLDLLRVFTVTGDDISAPEAGRLELADMTIPPGGVTVTVLARIHDAERLVAEDGVPEGGIAGFAIDNQATVISGLDQTLSAARFGGAPAPTRFTLSVQVDLAGAGTRKTVEDLDGGDTEPGDQLRYVVAINNIGVEDARVFVNDPLPALVEGCALERAWPELVCGAGRLQGFVEVASGATVEIAFTVRVVADAPDGGIIRNNAALRAGTQRVEAQSRALEVRASTRLTATKIAVGAVDGATVPGRTLTWTLRITNEGNGLSAPVTVVDPLGFDYAAVRPDQGGAYDAVSQTVTWRVDPIPGSETVELTVATTLPEAVADGTVLQNQARVVAAGQPELLTDDPTTAAADDPTRVTVLSQPLLTIDKTVDRLEARPGEQVAYTLTLRNEGTDIARDVTVLDPLPAGVFDRIVPGDGQLDGQTVRFTPARSPALAAVAPGDVIVLRFEARLAPALIDGLQVSNQATADGGFGISRSDDPTTPAAEDPTVFTVRSTATLQLEKTVDDLDGAPLRPGDRVRYALTVTAGGDGPALDVIVTDPLPADLADVAPLDGGVIAGGTIAWPAIARLDPGERRTVRFEATVIGAAGATIDNQARVLATGVAAVDSDDPRTPPIGDPTRLTVIAEPDLSTSVKTVEPRQAGPGDAITWRIRVINRGAAAATGVRVTDPFPSAFVEQVIADGGGVVGADGITWAIGDIGPGDTVELVVTGTLTAPIADGTRVVNQATITADGLPDTLTDDLATPAIDDATVLIVRSVPAITLTKTVLDENGPPAEPGDALTYTLVARSEGSDVVRGAELIDPLPNDTALIDGFGGRVVGDTLVWDLGDLAPGEEARRTLRVRIDNPLDNLVSIANQARVRAANLARDAISDDPATAAIGDPTVVTVSSGADFRQTSKTVDALDGLPFRPGGRVRYTIIVPNTGRADAVGVRIRDVVPAELLDVDAPGAVQAGGVVSWQTDIPAGEQQVFTLTGRLPHIMDNGTIVTNQATVELDDLAFDSDDPATPADDDPTAFTVVATPGLQLAKTAISEDGPPGRPGEAVTFTLTLDNDGDAPALAPEVVDVMPGGIVGPFEVDRPDARVEGRTVRWQPAVVEVGVPLVLTITARIAAGVPDGATITNTATVDDLRASAEIQVVQSAELVLFKSAQVDPVPGGRVIYTLDLANDGDRAADAVVMRDRLPAGLELIGTQPPSDQVGDTLVWNLGALDAGERIQGRIEAVIVDDALAGQVIANQAEVAADGLEAVFSDDPATPEVGDATAFTVESQAELSIDKVLLTPVPPGGLPPGSAVEYAITVSNAGVVPSEPVTITDVLSPQFDPATAVVPGGEVLGDQVRWAVDVVRAGDTVPVVLRVRLREGLDDGLLVQNQAVLFAEAGGRIAESEVVEFRVGSGGLVVEKTVEAVTPQGFAPGGRVLYAITVTNTRDVPVGNVSIVDPVPLDTLQVTRVLDGGLLDALSGRVDWTPATTAGLRQIQPGRSVQVRFEAEVRRDVPLGSIVVNEATARVIDDPDVATGAVRFIAEGSPLYEVDKQVLPGPTEPGSLLGYSIRISNVGQGPGEDVQLFDQLPRGVAYVPGSATVDGQPIVDIGGLPQFQAGLLLGDLAPSATVEVRFEVTIEAPAGTAIVNRAEIRDADGARAAGDVRFVVGGQPDLSSFVKGGVIVEDPTAERALIGQTIEWTLALRNNGNGDATDIEIVDPIGTGLAFVDDVIIVDGRPRTRAADGDGAEFVDGVVRVSIDRLEPGEVASIQFRTQVTDGPSVRNQAFARAARRPEQPSDDGGADENEPTVIPVGEPPRREVRIEKVADRLPDEIASAGEQVRFTLRLSNTGTVDLSGLEVIDTLPPGLLLDDIESLPPGARVVTEQGPEAEVIRLLDVDLPADEAVAVTIVTLIDPLLTDDRVLCNEVRFEGPGVEPDDDTACVQAAVRNGRLAGAVFEDVNSDGLFDAATDRTFAGMRVGFYREADPDGPPAAERITDDDGRYEIPTLAPGRYRARIFTSTDVLMATVGGIAIVPESANTANLVIDPSGRVYDSVEGDLIDDAQIFIYRDVDTNDDPFDDTSLQQRILVPPSDLEAPSQQGQRTSNGGLYRFAVRRPGRYIVEVVPPGESFVSPSVRVPPVPGTAFTSDPEGRVVADPLPSVAPDADRTYFLAFDLNTPDDFFQHNHIPIDPLDSLIDVQKRARRSHASVGEVATFTVDIVNRSPLDLVYDPATGTGGVWLQDVLPRGLKYVNRTATLARVRDGVEIPLGTYDPGGDEVRILRFGRFDTVDGEQVRRPMDLNAGEALRLRYHVVVGADATPRRILTNRAVLVTDGNIPISRTAEASLRIVADPDFDQGLLLGRVWCDEDGNGIKEDVEAGLGGVRLYVDNGYMAITDGEGRFHVQDIDPGTHAVKIDTGSLLPGATLTTDEVRVIHFTRGLPARIGFGVTCPAETVSGATLTLAEAGMRDALDALRGRFAVITGNVESLRAVHGEKATDAPLVAVALAVGESETARPDLPSRGTGTTVDMRFRTTLDPRAPRARWGLYVGPVGEPAVQVIGGTGAAPAEIPWDQLGPDGEPLLKAGTAYAYRLEVAGPDGVMVGSPSGVFGVGLTRPPSPEVLVRLGADDVDEEGNLTAELQAALTEALPKLKAAEGPLVVEVHHDNSLGVFSARSLTRRKAAAVAEALVELGMGPDSVAPEGVGGARPLAPNFTRRNQRRNRRIDIVRKPEATTQVAEVPAATHDRVVRFEDETVAVDESGDFAVTAPVPADGIVEIYLQGADGRRAMFPIRVREGAPPAGVASSPFMLEGTLPDALRFGGKPLPLPVLPPKLTPPNAVNAGADARLAVTAAGKLDGWRLSISGPDGQVAHTADGAGPPPSSLEWPVPADAVGTYRAQLTVRSGVAVARSPAASIHVGDLRRTRPVRGRWAMTVDGQPVIASVDGPISTRLDLAPGTPILLDISTPSGGRIAFFATPPAEGDAAAPSPKAAPPSTGPKPSIAGGGPLPGRTLPAGGTAAGPGPALPERVSAAPRTPRTPEQRAEMAAFGRQEVLQAIAPLLTADGADVAARTLTAELPADGSTLAGRSLPVRGTTAVGNRVFLNGAEVKVDRRGRYAGSVELPPGQATIEVSAVDPDGNRGVMKRAVVVPDRGWFLLALGESTVGQLQSPLDGVQPHTRLALGDQVYLHGRAAGWFKGYVKGDQILGGIVDEYRAEVHVDTARTAEFEGAFRQLVDPEQFYPVYGDEADLQKPINTRGPLYVLLEADASSARIGNFLTDFEGIELFRYDRALYGAQIDIDQKTGDFRHELTAFAADGDLGQRHGYVELRGTGGSLYYLPHRELVEGSERVYLVERDRISGIERNRRTLARDLDYTVRYEDGRILMKRPVSSVTMDSFGARLQPDRGEVLDGHPVYLAVEYDHHDPLAEGDVAVGVRAAESYGDAVRVGGGFVQEQRGEGRPDYQLWGADLTLRAGRRTRLEAEYARSQSEDGDSLRSDDGGLSFEAFDSREGARARGESLLVRGGLELDDLIGEGDRDLWYTEAYWQSIGAGFYSGGTIHEQGLTKYGGASRLNLDGGHQLHLRHDGVLATEPQTQGASSFAAFQRDTTRVGYGYRMEGLIADVELVHTTFDPGTDPAVAPDGVTGGAGTVSDALAAGVQYRFAPRWTALLEQEILLRSDERIHDDQLDLLTTTAGLRYQIDDTLSAEVLETLRWSGANATQIGLRTQIDDRHTVYVQERLHNDDDRTTSTTVLGGEERFGKDKSGRAYGEYQLETGTVGRRDRAVFGIGKRWKIIDGLAIDGGYERSQVVGGTLGEFSQDALTLGVEWIDHDRLTITGRYEMRYEDNDEAFDRRDRMQFLTLNALKLKLGPDFTALARINYSSTTDLVFEATEAELLEMSVGLGWRPVDLDAVAALIKYTKRYEQRPIDVSVERPEREESDVFSLIPIFELPLNLQIVEKLVYKRTALQVANMPTISSTTWLWINRLNHHLTETWDAGIEYRLLYNGLSATTEHGALLELNYIVQKRIRLGAGYNFTSFSDDEFASLAEDYGGPFFRVTAHY